MGFAIVHSLNNVVVIAIDITLTYFFQVDVIVLLLALDGYL
jgi:hypothetical protein